MNRTRLSGSTPMVLAAVHARLPHVRRAAGAAVLMGLTAAPALAQRGAELPRDTVAVPPAATTCTKTVDPGSNLQWALRRAKGGDVICLTPGGEYAPITLPERRDSGWVTLRTAAADSLFALEGERVRPSRAAALARIVAGKQESAIRTATFTRGWRLVGLEVTSTGDINALVSLGAGGPPQTSLDHVPRDIILDRLWIHGTPERTIRRCVSLQSAATAIVNSWLDDCHEKGSDSQAIWGGNGPGPYRIENNTLAGAGENILFGGSDPSIDALVPSDIVIRRNHIVTPISWKGRWSKKTLIEFKNAARVRIEDNVLEGSWRDGQVGYALLFKSANQSGHCPWCVTQDVTIRHNLVRNVGAGINLAGKAGGHPWPEDSAARRFSIVENLIENVNVAPYDGEGRLVQLLSGVQQVTFDRNVFISTGPVQRAISLENNNSAVGLVVRGNVFSHGQYGLIADGHAPGAGSVSAVPGAVFSANTFVMDGRGARGSSAPGFSYASSLSIVPAYASTRALVQRATAGVVVQP